ncbi:MULTISPECIES: colicin-like pore-forming protein [Pseudomonas]|uniref:Colicin transporter n=1 Tax=Pseudomonas azadiae TaxID=2843612 RepID=A0ABS6P3Z1_9PSED|nr:MULTISPECIES: colicin-like pore-forming protein [Pseudomonas]MBV4455148.1 colicin transporter [Pseudomonas azadiae]NMF44027.1 colicin transporter [Pseudomonas sp. SWRI 103]
MSTNGIELPPIIVTPDPLPPPPPLPPVPVVVPGVPGAQPPPTADVPVGTDVETLLSLPKIRSEGYIIPIAGKATRAQVDIEAAFNANFPNIAAETEGEVATALGDVSLLTDLEKKQKEKTVVDVLIAQSQDLLTNNNAVANSYFGRDPLAVEFKKNAVYLAMDITEAKRPGTPIEVYRSFVASISAVYESKKLVEKIRILTEKSNALTQAVAAAQAAEDERIAAEAAAKKAAEEAEAKRIAEEKAKEEEEIKGAIKFTADFYKEIGERYGAQMSALATDLAETAKGKTLRNAEEALKAFDQYRDHLDKKFSAADRAAIVNALDSLDRAELAKNLNIFAKGFGYTGKAFDAYDLVEEVKKSYASGDWNNTVLKVETLFAGSAATGLIAFAFGVTVSTPVGIVAFALIMALVSAYIDDAHVKQFNDALDAILP